MIIESDVFKLLSTNKELIALLESYRKGPFDKKYPSGIFVFDIPETPVNLKKTELAPMIRINPTYDNESYFSDDRSIASEQRVKIEFWCKTIKQSEEVSKVIDKILKENGYARYTANENPRYKDTDINLIMNIRKYRYFLWE